MSGQLPKYCFLTKGLGKGRDKLTSFEAALRDAGIAPFNIVKVSGILPPACKIIPKAKGLSRLVAGEIIYCVMSELAVDEPHRLIAASISIATPYDKSKYGYISEYHAYGETDSKAGDKAENLAVSMLATALGIKLDPNKNYDERKELYYNNKIVKTYSIAQSAISDKNGLWTTVLAAAVLLP